MIYEMRTYFAAPGKLDDLSARFRNHTCKLFEKHGMRNIGYWMPTENSEQRLVYILGHEDRSAAARSWEAFGKDPQWQAVVKETEKNGKLVTKIESVYMTATDYSAIK